MPVTTQFQAQNQPSQTKVFGAAYSVTLAQDDGAANSVSVDTFSRPHTPMRRFNWISSVLDSNVVIPAVYGVVAPLLIPFAGSSDDQLWFHLTLPAAIAFFLGFFRKNKRFGFMTGSLVGFVGCLAVFVDAALHYSSSFDIYNLEVWGLIMGFFGAVIGTVAAGIRQGAEWLFGFNSP